METGLIVTIAAMCVTWIGTMVVYTWMAAAKLTTITMALESIKGNEAKTQARLILLDNIPIIMRDIEQLKANDQTIRTEYARLKSEFPKQTTAIEVMRTRLESLHDPEETKR